MPTGMPLVTVSCVTYNHEKYIRDALEGFVMQKTNFPFEVIVHDDASTDGTADIIREYSKKYPNIIRPILQTENQFSQGVKISTEHILPSARGKYIAYCDGDDYWCDENKLQTLVDFLEQHPDYVACTHNNWIFDCDTGNRKKNFVCNDKDISINDVVMNAGKSFHDSSLVCRLNVIRSAPEFVYSIHDVEDYPKAIYLALSGKIHYLGNIMSVYRLHTVGSWSSGFLKLSSNEADARYETRIRMLRSADTYSDGKSHDIFLAAIEGYRFRQYRVREDYSSMISCAHFKTLSLSERLKLIIKYCLPFTRNLKKRMKLQLFK